MIILSNGFPTNMPNSEEVSQGGPANFARLFHTHIIPATEHEWLGIVFALHNSEKITLEKSFSFPQRSYYKVCFPKKFLREITQAKIQKNPEDILGEVIARVAKIILNKKPNVVFLNGFGIYNWILLKAAEKTGVPAVIQHAGIWTKELNLHKKRYSRAGLKMLEQMEKDSTRLTSAEIFLNTWSRDYYYKHVTKRKDGKSFVIPLPFDFNGFNSANDSTAVKSAVKLSKKHFRIGTIARWDKIKNHDAILSLARMSAYPKTNWHVYSITKIPEDEKHIRKTKSYQKNITIIKSLNRLEISDFYRSMNLIILPSLFDVSPTVVLEAFASKTPVAISSNVGYVHAFKKYGAGDWIINFDNPKHAIRRIKKIINRPMPKQLKEWILSNHDSKKVISSYLDLFEKVCKMNAGDITTNFVPQKNSYYNLDLTPA